MAKPITGLETCLTAQLV